VSLYVYGIANNAAMFDADRLGPGIGGSAVHLLPSGPLVALASPAPAGPVEGTRRNMLTHTAVLERAQAEADVLPIRFGTLAPDAEVLARSIAGAAGALQTALAGIAGRIELGVKASWRDGVAYREILDGDAALRALRDRLQSRPAAETYYERIELGRRVESALADRREADTRAILAELAPIAEREEPLKTLDDTMVLNRAFLVRREAEPCFDAAMERLAERFGSRLDFRYVGPVPPYNFVSLRAGWLTAGAGAAC
jgi:hypothetical protein